MRKCRSVTNKADSHSASQEISRLLLNPKVHYRLHNSPPLISILSQMYLVHTFPIYFPKIHSNTILPSSPRSSEWSLPFGFPTEILYAFLTSPMRTTRSAHLILLDLTTLLDPNILLNIGQF